MKFLRYMSVLLALSLGQSALAATFDFGSLGSVPSTGYSTSADGISVNITTPEGNKLGYYSFSSLGYGIGHKGCVFFVCSNGIQQNESLIITFSEAVTVTGLTLAAWDAPDKALVTDNNGNTLTLDDDFTSQVHTFDLSSLGAITSFSLKDTSFTGLFTLRGLEVSAVPVPAAAWLFGSAVLGLVGVRRKRH